MTSFHPKVDIIREVFGVPVPIGDEVGSRCNLLVLEKRKPKATPILRGLQRVEYNLIWRFGKVLNVPTSSVVRKPGSPIFYMQGLNRDPRLSCLIIVFGFSRIFHPAHFNLKKELILSRGVGRQDIGRRISSSNPRLSDANRVLTVQTS
jgi:hypothetical protein